MQSLRAWRLERVLSLRELEATSGSASKTIWDIEMGKRRPHHSTMRQISAALGVDPREVTEFNAALTAAATRPAAS